MSDLRKEIENKVAWVREHSEDGGVAWVKMGTLPDGRDLCLVFGWSEAGYEFGDCEYQEQVGDTTYTLCSKLAVNIDDLQCDYDIDWYMPSWKNDGEVCDTDMAVSKDFDLDYYLGESKAIIEGFKKKELEV